MMYPGLSTSYARYVCPCEVSVQTTSFVAEIVRDAHREEPAVVARQEVRRLTGVRSERCRRRCCRGRSECRSPPASSGSDSRIQVEGAVGVLRPPVVDRHHALAARVGEPRHCPSRRWCSAATPAPARRRAQPQSRIVRVPRCLHYWVPTSRRRRRRPLSRPGTRPPVPRSGRVEILAPLRDFLLYCSSVRKIAWLKTMNMLLTELCPQLARLRGSMTFAFFARVVEPGRRVEDRALRQERRGVLLVL